MAGPGLLCQFGDWLEYRGWREVSLEPWPNREYPSAASRTTQASDTFFPLAISSSLWYRSGGKLIDARTQWALFAFPRLFATLFLVIVALPW